MKRLSGKKFAAARLSWFPDCRKGLDCFMQDVAEPCQFVGNPMGADCHSNRMGDDKIPPLFPKKRTQNGVRLRSGTYCMDLLVAWEALSILLPMASTSFPIPLIVLQEERARAAASVKRADLIFISRREVESRILTFFRFLVNEPGDQ